MSGVVFLLAACLTWWALFSALSAWLDDLSGSGGRRPAVTVVVRNDRRETPTPLPDGWREVTVSARSGWQSTGLCVRQGQSVQVVYRRGAWSVWGGPKQQADGAGHVDEYRRDVPVPDAPVGALIGRIGEEQPFYVGNHLTYTTRDEGTLWLRINDRWLDDNTGALRVLVTIGPSE